MAAGMKWMIVSSVVIVIVLYFYTNKDYIFKSNDMEQLVRHEVMINTVQQIRKQSKTIMVAVINDAFLPFAYSWLCNTKEMGVHKNTLFITTDEQTSRKLKRDWPEISVASMNITNLSGDRSFGQAGYIRVNVKRHQYIYKLLQEGFELLHFEVDCVWLKNPLPVLQSQVGYDLLVNAATSLKDYASGFIYIYNTGRSVRVWELLAQNMTDLENRIALLKDDKQVEWKDNDQPYLSDIIFNRVKGFKLKVLTLDRFADGMWYNMKEDKRNATDPYIINNNFVIGNKAKKERAKAWNHWFIDEHMKCNMDLVHKIVKK